MFTASKNYMRPKNVKNVFKGDTVKQFNANYFVIARKEMEAQKKANNYLAK
jgi:hypothetical protein